MNRSRHGYALIEMLVIAAVIVILTALSVKPLRTAISEMPRSAGICQSLNATTRAIKQIKQDIEQSVEITGFNNETLTLQHPDGPVIYTLTDEQIIRRPGLSQQDAQSTWHLPNVVVKADLWKQNGRPYAVELTTYNSQIVLGIEQHRFRQSTVFFKKGIRQ